MIWFNREVLPDPRKPPMIVTGIGEMFELELLMNVPLIILLQLLGQEYYHSAKRFHHFYQ
jgi:hypothetical protein